MCLSANLEMLAVRFHPSIAVFSLDLEALLGTISPLESKLAMFQCKEDRKIL